MQDMGTTCVRACVAHQHDSKPHSDPRTANDASGTLPLTLCHRQLLNIAALLLVPDPATHICQEKLLRLQTKRLHQHTPPLAEAPRSDHSREQSRGRARRKSGIMSRAAPTGGSRKISFNVSEQYDIQDVVGEGAYGVVCSALHKPSGQKVAIKKIQPFEHCANSGEPEGLTFPIIA